MVALRVPRRAVLLVAVLTPWVQATEQAKLNASGAGNNALFGTSISVSGDTVVVGALNVEGAFEGSAHVFVRSGTDWSEQALLTAADPEIFDSFGDSVSVSGDTIVAGVPYDNHVNGSGAEEGSAHVFVRSGTTWSQQAMLTASAVAGTAGFGRSVAISGDRIVVGAGYALHAGGQNAGAAFVFERSGTIWSEQAMLTASDAEGGDSFGCSVAIAGGTVLVGAAYDDHAGRIDAGSAYVFSRIGTNWCEQAKLTASDAAGSDQFGTSVALAADVAVVGAYRDDHAPDAQGSSLGEGSAYAFQRGDAGWSERAKLTASDAAHGDWFGYTVSISDGTILVGARYDDHSFPGAGSAYVFARGGTSSNEQVKLTASDAAPGDAFGEAVSIDGDTAVVTALHDDLSAVLENVGSAYVFGLSPAAVSYCTAGTSASGCRAMVSAAGTPSATAVSGFVLSARDVEGAANGLFFFGTNGRQTAPWGSGTSYQCVLPPVTRAELTTGTGNAGHCNGSLDRDLNAHWHLVPASNPGAGAIVQAQLWYRDPFNTSDQTTSLSDAIEFLVGP